MRAQNMTPNAPRQFLNMLFPAPPSPQTLPWRAASRKYAKGEPGRIAAGQLPTMRGDAIGKFYKCSPTLRLDACQALRISSCTELDMELLIKFK